MRASLAIALLLAALLPSSALSEGFGCPFGDPLGQQSTGRDFGRAFGSPPTCFNSPPSVTGSFVDSSADIDDVVYMGTFGCSDDGFPDPPSTTEVSCIASGPGECVVGPNEEGGILAECDEAGSYTITCTCCDNVFSGDTCTGLSDSDTATLTVGAVPVIDAIVAAGGSVPNACYSISHQLYFAYSGNLIRIRRASDAAEVNVGQSGGFWVSSTVASHCAGTTCTIVTLYDQCGSARDVTQATVADQPTIYSSGAIHVYGSLPWASFDGTDYWARGDSAGVTGATDATIVHFTLATAGSAFAEVGTFLSLQYFGAVRSTVNARNSISGAVVRTFTPATALTTPSLLVHRLVGGADIAATSIRQNGADLSGTTSGSGVTSLGSAGFSIGARINGSSPVTGGGNFWLLTGSLLTGGPLTAVESFGAELRTLGGV
jgi:hypothetical protein